MGQGVNIIYVMFYHNITYIVYIISSINSWQLVFVILKLQCKIKLFLFLFLFFHDIEYISYCPLVSNKLKLYYIILLYYLNHFLKACIFSWNVCILMQVRINDIIIINSTSELYVNLKDMFWELLRDKWNRILGLGPLSMDNCHPKRRFIKGSTPFYSYSLVIG